jgi:uncharacterized membrane protein
MKTRLVIGPNASLTGGQALLFLGGVAVVALGIGVLFAARGAWPILPFAGLELAALGAALWVCLQRNRYREVIDFDGPWVRVEVGLVGKGVHASWELERCHTRAFLERDASRTSPLALVLASGAQRLVIGRCLTDEERVALCARLKQLLSPGWATPAEGDQEPGREPAQS